MPMLRFTHSNVLLYNGVSLNLMRLRICAGFKLAQTRSLFLGKSIKPQCNLADTHGIAVITSISGRAIARTNTKMMPPTTIIIVGSAKA